MPFCLCAECRSELSFIVTLNTTSNHAEGRAGYPEGYRQQNEGQGPSEAQVLLPDVQQAVPRRERLQMSPHVRLAPPTDEDIFRKRRRVPRQFLGGIRAVLHGHPPPAARHQEDECQQRVPGGHPGQGSRPHEQHQVGDADGLCPIHRQDGQMRRGGDGAGLVRHVHRARSGPAGAAGGAPPAGGERTRGGGEGRQADGEAAGGGCQGRGGGRWVRRGG
mmetsp:Transcript_19825/g.56974  ORF Transcript_19825/g.56974 Transcript_19825/m.56974 type:complete len:219 (+) Transcript_19825:198-854(+)